MKRRLKEIVWGAASNLGLRLVRTPRGSPAIPEQFVKPDIDFVLGHYLLRRDQSRPFFFIQIGAFDGVTDDPIHEYVRRFGWHGVLLEPQLRYFKLLEENYRGCPGLVLLPAALDWKSGTRTLYSLRDPEAPGLPWWAAMTGSFSHARFTSDPDLPTNIDHLITADEVATITFDEVLAAAGTDEIDLIQIDVEGYDVDILEMIDFSRVKPAIVRFEHEGLSRAKYRAASRLLTGLGYRLLPEKFDTCAYSEPHTLE